MTDSKVVIRLMSDSDVTMVASLEQQIFTDPWSEQSFAEALTVSQPLNRVATGADGTLCGYLCGQLVADEVQIHNVAVVPSYRRRGLGRALLEHAEREGKSRGAVCAVLEVRITNVPALAMYGRLGYRRIGRRRAYYRKPVCDALVLLKIFAANAAGDI